MCGLRGGNGGHDSTADDSEKWQTIGTPLCGSSGAKNETHKNIWRIRFGIFQGVKL